MKSTRLVLQTAAILIIAIILSVRPHQEDEGNKIVAHNKKHVSKIQSLNAAKVIVQTVHTANFVIESLSDECYQCHPNVFCEFENSTNCTGYVDTRWAITLIVSNRPNKSSESVELCSTHEHFRAYGTYSLIISNVEVNKCTLHSKIDNAPENIYIAILTAVCVLLGIGIFFHIGYILIQRGVFNGLIIMWKTATTYSSLSESQERLRDTSSGLNNNGVPVRVKKRLHSLDTFRGLSLTVMIFVNYGGGGYWFFKHSPWNGLTVADLVFPWFMWIMGVSMIFSLKGQLRRCLPRWFIVIKIVKRSFILFSLGIILNSMKSNDLLILRIPGVLQRFGVCYLVVGSTELFFIKAGDVTQLKWFTIGESVKDRIKYFIEWGIILIFPTIHLLLTFLLDVPGCPTGYLGPGGKNLNKSLDKCTGGSAGYIDRLVFGNNHIYQHPTCKAIYDTVLPYDPEGILGCLTSIFLVFLGAKAGKILIMHQNKKIITGWWIYWGVITGVAAGVLCNFSQNEGWIPINKNLWSFSFVLCMASFAFFLLTCLYIIIDVKFWWSGSPFIYPGMNSILVYVGSELTGSLFPWSWKTGCSHWETLFCNIWGASLWVIISVCLYFKRLFFVI